MKTSKPYVAKFACLAFAAATVAPAVLQAQPTTNVGQILTKQERLINLELDEKLAQKTAAINKITNPVAPTNSAQVGSVAPSVYIPPVSQASKPVQQKRDVAGEFSTHAVYGTDSSLTLEFSYLGQRATARRGEINYGWRLVALTNQTARFIRVEADKEKSSVKVGATVDIPVRLVAADTATMRTLLAPSTPSSGPLPSGVPSVLPSPQTPQSVGQFAQPGLPPAVGLPQGTNAPK
jgi:hypothetical protein